MSGFSTRVLSLTLFYRFSWLNAQETRQRRQTESDSAEKDRLNALSNGNRIDGNGPGGGIAGQPSGVRTLTTQMSSVRDEPTPTPQTQSPAQSKESTPVPGPTLGDIPSEAEQDKEREEARTALSKTLFEAMLKRNDSAPPPPINGDEKQNPPNSSSSVTVERAPQVEEVAIKTSEFVKKGLIPLEVAYRAMQQDMRNEQKAVAGMDTEGEDSEGGMIEFSLANI